MLIAVLLEEMIADLGHEVIGRAAALDEALQMARDGSLDVAILDVNLNGEDVHPVADVLAARGIPFAFSTGYGQRRLPEPHRDRPILHKPFQRHDVAKIFTGLVSQSPGSSTGRSGS